MGKRQHQAQVESALSLIAPMGELIEVMNRIVRAHHPVIIDDEDCPVCAAFNDEMGPLLDRWNDARARVGEHWDV